jgi:hypothetical protein
MFRPKLGGPREDALSRDALLEFRAALVSLLGDPGTPAGREMNDRFK